jgi:hypothetical protein
MGNLFCDVNYEHESTESSSRRENMGEVSSPIENELNLVLDRLSKFKRIQKEVSDFMEKGIPIKWANLGRDLRGVTRYNYGKTVSVEVNSNLKGKPEAIAVLLHELIHSIGGTELDAEFFENVCCTKNEGAELPTPDDYPKFMNEGSTFLDVKSKSLKRVEVYYQGVNKIFTKY